MGCSRNFAIRSALLISMKKGGFPVNGWNSCIRLWSWRDFRQEHLKRSAFCAGGKRPCKSDGRKADCASVYDVSDVVFGVAGTCTGRAHGSSAAVYPDIPSEGSIASCDGDRDDSGGIDVRRGWCNGGGAKQVRSKKNVRCRWKSGVCRAAGFVYIVRAAGVTKQLLIVRGSGACGMEIFTQDSRT